MASENLLVRAAGAAPVVGQAFADEYLEETTVSQLRFEECSFSNCNFDYAVLKQAYFINCRFTSCSFKETVFEDAQFCEGETANEWRYSDLAGAVFRRCNLSLNKFIGCDGIDLQLIECAAQGTKFDINVHRKIASKIIPVGIRFEKCKLQYADFSGADLTESIFESSDLRDVNFAGCDLSHASLRGSAINNADFEGSILDNANMAHATFDAFDLQAPQSHRRLVVSRDQHESILATMGIVTLD